MSTVASPKTAGFTLATGRRKTAVARRLKAAPQIVINNERWKIIFPVEKDRFQVLDALNQTGKLNAVDLNIHVHAAVLAAAGRLQIGIARAPKGIRHGTR